MKRYDLESCDGYAESCNAKMLEYKTGDYVLYDEVQPQLSILAKAVLEAHVCSNCPELVDIVTGEPRPCKTMRVAQCYNGSGFVKKGE